MDRCDSRRLQDYLDGELTQAESAVLREHLASCGRCAAELALYRRTFEALTLTLDPPPAFLVDRVLDHVLPSRVRRRWVKTLGWSYAGVFAACLVGAVMWASQPATHAWLAGFADGLSRRFVQGVTFALNAVAFLLVSLAEGWGWLATASQRVAPFTRALATLLSNSGVQIALVTAAVACAALLWWIRPREKRGSRGVRHVGVLGF